jgi:hypothetical protein
MYRYKAILLKGTMSIASASRRRFLSHLGGAAALFADSGPAPGADTGPVRVMSSGSSAEVAEAVLFPFDDCSIPFSRGLRVDLIPAKKHGEHPPIVLRHGKPGNPDALAARYYGAVAQVGDELHMWYQGVGEIDSAQGFRQRRLLYATSRDGSIGRSPSSGW